MDHGYCVHEGVIRRLRLRQETYAYRPVPRGISTVGGTGSVYEFYANAMLTDKPITSEFKVYVNKEKSADGNAHRVAPEKGLRRLHRACP